MAAEHGTTDPGAALAPPPPCGVRARLDLSQADGSARAGLHDVLRRLALFSQLSTEQLMVVAAAAREVSLARGEVLFHVGDPCTAFFAVVSGQVKLTLSAPDGAEKVLEIISPGETFGEAVVFAGYRYPVTAVGLAPTSLVSIPGDAVLALVEADPMFARRMLAGMAVRLHLMVKDVAEVSLRSGTQRVVGFLLGLAGARPLPRSVVRLPAAKAVLASRLSLSAETFSRTLRELSEAGLISVEGRAITLLDVRGLTEAVGDDAH